MNTREAKIEAFGHLLDVQERLRKECPWDRKQTFQSLRPNTIEETFELADALMNNDMHNVKKELGDVMEHVLFYAILGDESGEFDIADVCNRLSDKLVFRHPHVFPPEDIEAAGAKILGSTRLENENDVAKMWEKIKQVEKDGNATVLSGVPSALPSLIKAYRIQEKARNVGFDWDNRSQVWEKVKEEIAELEKEWENGDARKAEHEFGDVLFSLVNAARLYKINPDNALEHTNQKFIRRFNYLEQKAIASGRKLSEMTLEEMDKIWEESKALEQREQKSTDDKSRASQACLNYAEARRRKTKSTSSELPES